MHPKAPQTVKFIRYERNMVEEAVRILSLPETPSSKMLRNMALESLLVHARALADFFTGHREKGKRGAKLDDDILAIDFLNDPDAWRSQARELMPYVQAERERLNKAITHLSYSRIAYASDPELGNWETATILSETHDAWNRFMAALPPVVRDSFNVPPRESFTVPPNLCNKTST